MTNSSKNSQLSAGILKNADGLHLDGTKKWYYFMREKNRFLVTKVIMMIWQRDNWLDNFFSNLTLKKHIYFVFLVFNEVDWWNFDLSFAFVTFNKKKEREIYNKKTCNIEF